jgi:hypothetical protein
MKVPFLVSLSVPAAFCVLWLGVGCTPRPEIKAPIDTTADLRGESSAPSTGKISKESSGPATGRVATKSGSPEAKKPTGSAASSSEGVESLTPDCRELLAQIHELDKQIPWYYHETKRSSRDIHSDMVACRDLCERFLSECPQSALECEVKGILTRVLFGRQGWAKREIEEEYSEKLKGPPKSSEAWGKWTAYMSRLDGLAEEVRSQCGPGSRARRTVLWVQFEVHMAAVRYSQARKVAKEIVHELELTTDTGQEVEDIKSGVHMDVAYSFNYENSYAATVDYLRAVIDENHQDPEYILYNDILFQGLTGVGDLEGMREFMYQVRAEYPERLPAIPTGYLVQQYEHGLYISHFWLGYVCMALGDMEGAASHFQDNILEINDFHHIRKIAGKLPLSYLEVYRDQRSGTLLRFIRECYGRVPEIQEQDGSRRPLDFDLGDLWATERRLSLKESKGKVVVVLFRRPGNRSAIGFLQAIDRFVGERAKDGLEAITLGFVRRKANPRKDALRCKRMREELNAGKVVNFAGGFDPDRKRHRIFRAFCGTVGTPSLVLLDRQGKIAWFLADPRNMQVALTERVIDRLLKEKAD